MKTDKIKSDQSDREEHRIPAGSDEGRGTSRRRLLKAATWAMPLVAMGTTAQLLQGCTEGVNDHATNTQPGDGNVTELGARAAVDRIRNGEMKTEDYVAQLLKHYNAHKNLNAIITIDEARVLQDARAVDQTRARGDRLGPLAGLPFVVKDQIDVAGYPTTAGNIALKVYVPKRTAAVVDAMQKAGGIVFAKANCADLVGQVRPNGVTSSNPYFGFVRNPYNLMHNPGGSSGGNGAAIAARIVPAGLGEDGGGSIRLPASSCGIAGLRASTYSPENILKGTAYKRYSDHGIVPPAGLNDTFGPMARTVADVAFLDTVITGEKVPSVDIREVRIGIPRADYWENEYFDPEVVTVAQSAFAKLRDAGAQLIEVDYNALLQLHAGNRLMSVRPPSRVFEEWLAHNVPGVTIKDVNRLRDSYPPDPYYISRNTSELTLDERKGIIADAAHYYANVFESNGIAALAAPTIPVPPPLINSNGDTPWQKILVNGKWLDEWDTIISNLSWGARLGAPGLSLPIGLTSGLPAGLQLQGLPGSDSQILGIGLAVEKILGPLPPPTFRNAEIYM